ncbi:MAG: FAD:protein FMN transferase, partial [Oscillospiraceae bacterium]
MHGKSTQWTHTAKAVSAVLAAVLVAALFTGCQGGQVSTTVFAMDTVMEINADSESELDECTEEINRLDEMLSADDPESPIYKLNEGISSEVPEEAAGLISEALEYSELTEGAFD